MIDARNPTESYPRTDHPDSLMGAILAIEGIRDAVVVLNGPTGCKVFYGWLSDQQYPRADHLSIARDFREFFFGQSRIPCTYLDEQDYVFGASEKLARILPAVAGSGEHALIAIVNSPGAALIGDDLQRFLRGAKPAVATMAPTIATETPGFSEDMAAGFQRALQGAMETLAPPLAAPWRPARPRTINLLGLSIYHQHWQGSLVHLTEFLRLMGIEVLAAPGAGSSVAEIERIAEAECNIVIHQEYADTLAPWIESRYGTPSLFPSAGAPVGFDATEEWLREVAGALSLDPAPALSRVREDRGIAFAHLNRFQRHTGLPKGAAFALAADASVAAPLLRWLHGYLGMAPTGVRIDSGAGTPLAAGVHEYLSEAGCPDAWEADLATDFPDLVLASGVEVARLVGGSQARAGIGIAQPAGARIDVVPKALLGSRGSLFLLEWILDALHEHLV